MEIHRVEKAGGRVVLRTLEQEKQLVERAQAVMKVHTHETAPVVPVESVVASAALAEAGKKLGVLPSVYAELIAAGISNDTLVTLFAQLAREGITGKRFRKEIRDIAASLLDMRKEAISEAVALQVLQKAIVADPSLREVTTIVADFINLIEGGFATDSAMAAVTMAIAADPTLREHGTITSFLTDLKEKGFSDTDALAKAQAAITMQQASEIALRAVPGTIIEVSRDKDRGRLIWEVLIRRADGTGVEVYVNATTGAILKQESVSPGDF